MQPGLKTSGSQAFEMELGPSGGAGEQAVRSVGKPEGGKPGAEEAEVGVPHSSFCPEKSRQCVMEVRPPCVPGEASEGADAGTGPGSRLLPFTCLSGTGSRHTTRVVRNRLNHLTGSFIN